MPGLRAAAQPQSRDRDAWVDWGWVEDNLDEIWAALREHIVLTVLAVGIGLAIAVPLALVSRRSRGLYAGVLSVTGVLYTIPSLALFALLIPYTGLSRTTALIPLVTYTLLILIRNIVTGLDGVPSDAREAAVGMGYSRRGLLWRVEVPLAMPTIMAGIRIATVTTIGLVTVTAVIGQNSLGQLIFDGLNRDFRTPLVVGAGLSIALAVVADLGLALVQRLATPWTWRGGRQ
jgi:osmoprotectant transport system permease protein